MDSIERLELKGTNVTLVADALGPGDGAPVLFLPGSGQTRQSWSKALGEAARRGYRGISLDLRGHGDSGWSPDGVYELPLFAEDLAVVLAQFERPPVVVGASLGGLAGMLVAAKSPEFMRALVLVDITARIEMEGANEVMKFMGSAAQGFGSLEEAADAVSAYLPHRDRPSSTQGLERNLRVRNGRYFWHWDPAFMTMGQDAGERKEHAEVLETAARALTLPVLLVRGGRSRILSEEGAREFLEMVPHADYAGIDDAHHMVAGDANDAFNAAIFDFIAKQAEVGVTPAR
jgi:pimeloyl-ACP methyl ester carboxylesterase